ncbi:MAG: C39 family peptidase [Kofleriaceae bacterium]|nr:C39 family peptidase [Kofleriaceae bacterium]
MRITRAAIRVELPPTAQRTDYTCGAAAVRSVATFYGVGRATEAEVAADMRMTVDGSDPVQLRRALARYGLAHREHRGMTDTELRAYLDARCPVIIMLQAWGARRSYRAHWDDGHWVVVIGYDVRGVFVMDPSLERERGFLRWRDLDERWHDIEGRARHHVERYGLAVWSARRSRPARDVRRACVVR